MISIPMIPLELVFKSALLLQVSKEFNPKTFSAWSDWRDNVQLPGRKGLWKQRTGRFELWLYSELDELPLIIRGTAVQFTTNDLSVVDQPREVVNVENLELHIDQNGIQELYEVQGQTHQPTVQRKVWAKVTTLCGQLVETKSEIQSLAGSPGTPTATELKNLIRLIQTCQVQNFSPQF